MSGCFVRAQCKNSEVRAQFPCATYKRKYQVSGRKYQVQSWAQCPSAPTGRNIRAQCPGALSARNVRMAKSWRNVRAQCSCATSKRYVRAKIPDAKSDAMSVRNVWAQCPGALSARNVQAQCPGAISGRNVRAQKNKKFSSFILNEKIQIFFQIFFLPF